MRLAVDILSAVLEIFILHYFFSQVFAHKRKLIWLEILLRVLCFSLFVVISTYLLTTFLAPVLFLCVVFIYSYLYNDKTMKRLLYSLLIYVFTMIAETIIGIFISISNEISIEQTQTDIYYYLMGMILSKFILIISFRLLGIIKFNKEIDLDIKSIFAIAVIEISSIVSVYYLTTIAYKFNNVISPALATILTIIITFANIATFYLLKSQINLQKSRDNLINIELQYKLQTEYYSELKENLLSTNSQVHDFKNFIISISSYIDSEKNDDAKAKIEEFYGKIPILEQIDTGNAAVDALIMSKMKIIKKEIPKHDFSIIIPKILNVDEIDLCVLIGNAIDNSIEACIKIPNIEDRSFTIKIFPFNNQLSMLFENTKINKKENDFLTSKANKLQHGFGINNMKKIIQKYEGNIVFEQNESKFTVSAFIPNVTKEV